MREYEGGAEWEKLQKRMTPEQDLVAWMGIPRTIGDREEIFVMYQHIEMYRGMPEDNLFIILTHFSNIHYILRIKWSKMMCL